MTAPARITLPDWPAAMSKQTVADYLQVSLAAVDRMVIAGELPTSCMIGGKERWAKKSIDAALDMLTGANTISDAEEELRNRYGT